MSKKVEKKTVKPVSKKSAPAKVKSVKKAAPKKAAPKKEPPKEEPPKEEPPKKVVNRVPPRIAKKPEAPAPMDEASAQEAAAKAMAFAMSIALEKKRSAAQAEQVRTADEIRLSRRPTTRTQGKDSVKFPASDLKEFRKRLLEARVRALAAIDRLKATGFNESEDHEADGGDGTNQTLRLQALGQIETINRTIQKVDEALHRIDDGTYGVCTSCGQLIRKPRLLNQPSVLTCMECQSAMEREGK